MVTCEACGAQCSSGMRFCGQCGTPLPAARATVQERKVVTTLFCDLVAFTTMTEGTDPEDVHAVVTRYFSAARDAIEAFGGVVEKFIGDAVVGVFGVPAAHEDDPERAVRAGLRIHDTVAGLTRPDGSPLELRVGVNTGEVLVRLDVNPASGEGVLTGDAVNTAARIQSVAPAMGVAVGRSTFEATKQVFDYRELEPVVVKGKSEPLRVWQAVTPLARLGTDITRRHDSPLVGRESDLAALTALFDTTVSALSPGLVTIVGEPGLGKSRLVAELGAYVDQLPVHVTWRQGRCLPYGEGITFWAVSEIVKAHAGIYDTDPAEVALGKLDTVLPYIEERAWLRERLLPLLGVQASSTAQQSELFTAWRRFLESIAEAGPTVLVLEDLHWAEPALLAFVEHLADHTAGVPLLVVATARPELLDRCPEHDRRPATTTITLRPLTELETASLVAALLRSDVVPDELRAPLVEQAGGNPLFAEEYVRLLEDRDLIRRDDVEVGLRPSARLPVPDSVQALIAARLDALPPDRKALLADAAVIGTVFWAGAVATLAGRDEDEVSEVMRELSRRELVRPVRQPSMAGQQEYTFWHVLTRDVAYAQLPRAVRAGRHVAAAEWLEARAGDRVEDQADLLAHHYGTALDLALAAGNEGLAEQLRPATVQFLLLAGEHALGLDAAAAISYLERAAALAPQDHPLRARMLMARGLAAHYTGRLPAAQDDLEQAVVLFAEAGDFPHAVDVLAELSIVLRFRGDSRWWSMADEMQALAAPLPPGRMHVRIETQVAFCEGLRDDQEAALEHADRALALAEELGLPTPARTLGYRAMFRCNVGDPGGIQDFHRAIALATEAGLGRDAGVMYGNLSMATFGLHGPAAALAVCEEGVAYTDARGLVETRDALLADTLGFRLPLGAVDTVLARTEQLAATLEAADNQFQLFYLRQVETSALLLRGEAAATTGWLDWLAALGRDVGDLASGVGAAAQAHAALGHRDHAVALFTELVGQGVAAGGDLSAWVRSLVALDRTDLAEQLVPAEPTAIPVNQHDRVAARAVLAEARGDHVVALAGYLDAAARWHDFTMGVEEAFALLGEGRCLIALGRADEAVSVLQQTRDLFVKIGALPAVAEAESLLASLY